jgi:type II secretory pathway predicted ATPase ExeA
VTRGSKAYSLGFIPILLKQLTLDCGISQGALAEATGASRPTINLCLNRGYVPNTMTGFTAQIEQLVRQHPRAALWLAERSLPVAGIWSPLGQDLRLAMPAGHSGRTRAGMKQGRVELGDPTEITITQEVEMLHPEAMKQFRLFRHPFRNDVNGEKDVFLSDEHRYIEAAMLDAALHTGFLAVIGEVQGGKSTIRKKVVESLLRDGKVSVIYPRSHKINLKDSTKSRIDATGLCDAIIMDVSSDKPKNKIEAKLRQLEQLLIARTNQGYKNVLILEEAHNLTLPALKYLKPLYEFEDGFRKLLSIILIGQPELKDLLDQRRHPELREVIQRIQVAEIRGLNGNLRPYLEFKLKRVGSGVDQVFAEGAIEALSRRLTVDDGNGRKVSQAYPGLVNLSVVRAINLAYELGEKLVTEEVIDAVC